MNIVSFSNVSMEPYINKIASDPFFFFYSACRNFLQLCVADFPRLSKRETSRFFNPCTKFSLCIMGWTKSPSFSSGGQPFISCLSSCLHSYNQRAHTEWQWSLSGVQSIIPFHYISTITYKVVVYAPAERADTYYRVHILVEMKQGQCICPLSWSVHCNFSGEGKCSEWGWACTPPPPLPARLILLPWWNVRQKAAVTTLCTPWQIHSPYFSSTPICTLWLQPAGEQAWINYL